MMMFDDHCIRGCSASGNSRLWKYEMIDLTTGWLRGTVMTPVSAGEEDSER